MGAIQRQTIAAKAFSGMYPELWELMKTYNNPNWRTEGSSTTMTDAINYIDRVSDYEIEFYTMA